jgi:hypothetical protein
MRHPTPEDWDRRRDLRKHDWRPGDPPEQRAADDVAEQAAYAAAASYYNRLIEVEPPKRSPQEEADRARRMAAMHYFATGSIKR